METWQQAYAFMQIIVSDPEDDPQCSGSVFYFPIITWVVSFVTTFGSSSVENTCVF
jgi:hypothetical protein